MLEHFSYLFLLPSLFLVGLIGGTVDAIAGGGGLISLPILLSFGLPPQVALGTNKLQTSIGTLLATHSYYQQGWFSFRTIYKTLLIIALGTIFGAILGQHLQSGILQKVIPILLLLILAYFIAAPKPSSVDAKPKMNSPLFFALFGCLLGFYDGFLGPGVGAFWMFALIFFLGYNLTTATAHTKVFNLTSNLVATVCFAIGHCIDYRIALCMALGQIIGGKLGAYLAIKKGATLIRPIFIAIVFFTLSVLFYKNYALSEYSNILLGVLGICLFVFILWSVRRTKFFQKT